MTDEQINVAIAEECGYTGIHYDWINGSDAIKDWMHDKGRGIPSYTSDLNAMHEAELIFRRSAQKRLEYGQFLTSMCADDNSDGKVYGREVWNATAHQRAECFLRVKGKWKD